jgi:hypothetical protein
MHYINLNRSDSLIHVIQLPRTVSSTKWLTLSTNLPTNHLCVAFAKQSSSSHGNTNNNNNNNNNNGALHHKDESMVYESINERLISLPLSSMTFDQRKAYNFDPPLIPVDEHRAATMLHISSVEWSTYEWLSIGILPSSLDATSSPSKPTSLRTYASHAQHEWLMTHITSVPYALPHMSSTSSSIIPVHSFAVWPPSSPSSSSSASVSAEPTIEENEHGIIAAAAAVGSPTTSVSDSSPTLPSPSMSSSSPPTTITTMDDNDEAISSRGGEADTHFGHILSPGVRYISAGHMMIRLPLTVNRTHPVPLQIDVHNVECIAITSLWRTGTNNNNNDDDYEWPSPHEPAMYPMIYHSVSPTGESSWSISDSLTSHSILITPHHTSHWSSQYVMVMVDPRCTYHIDVRYHPLASLSQALRVFGRLILPAWFVFLWLGLALQLSFRHVYDR